MWPFSRSQHKDEAVVNYVSPSLYQWIRSWLNMLDLYRNLDKQAEFETVARQLHEDFNVELLRWRDDGKGRAAEAHLSLEDFPHIVERLIATWQKPEAMTYVYRLLEEKRAGARSGFPITVFEDILLLANLLEVERGAVICADDAPPDDIAFG